MLSLRRLLSTTAGKSPILIDARFLEQQQHTKSPSPLILEVASNPAIFNRAHIAGARLLPTAPAIPASLKHVNDTEMAPKPGAGMISLEKFKLVVEQIGAKSCDDFIVLYDDAGTLFSARVWWVMRSFGFRNVCVLNGGWNEWIRSKGDVEFGLKKVEPGKIDDLKFNQDGSVVDLKEMQNLVEKGETQIIDSRPWDEYTGKNSRGNKFVGRVPNAKFFDLNGLWSDGKLDRDPLKIERVIEDAGISPHRDTVLYCHSAFRATAAALILHEYGFDRVRIYEGSMSEWNNIDGLAREQ
jgi:3-mercaptopyruvate sulfurtransferase SseA